MNSIHHQRRHFAFSLLAGAVLAAPAWAQTPGPDVLSIIAPYPAGGASDVVARILLPGMAKSLGKTMIVENIAGVAGSLGAQKLLSTGTSGQAMLVGSPNEVILAQLALKVVKYKAADFKLVAHLATAGVVVFARPDFPANSIDELVKLAKAPGAKPLTHAMSGKGSVFHLASESFAQKLGLDLTQVPYRGGAPAVQDLGGSVVDLMFGPMIPQYAQMVESGRMKILGIAAAQRSPAQPKVQAYGEVPALKDNYFTAWVGIFVPAGTGNEAAARIAKAAHEGAATPEFQNMLKLSGNVAGPVLTLEQAAAFYKSETERYEQIARSIKLEAE